MTNAEISLVIAAKEPNWEQMDAASKAATVIMVDCHRRLEMNMGALADDIKDEMIDEWGMLIGKVLETEIGAKR